MISDKTPDLPPGWSYSPEIARAWNTAIRPVTLLCEACGGEGRIWKSRYGGNDPDVWDAGPCPVCNGTAYVEVDSEAATMDEVEDDG